MQSALFIHFNSISGCCWLKRATPWKNSQFHYCFTKKGFLRIYYIRTLVLWQVKSRIRRCLLPIIRTRYSSCLNEHLNSNQTRNVRQIFNPISLLTRCNLDTYLSIIELKKKITVINVMSVLLDLIRPY